MLTPATFGIGNASLVEGELPQSAPEDEEGKKEVVVSAEGEKNELMDHECELSVQYAATPELFKSGY